MGNTQFTKNELDYINEDVFDSTQDIYAYAKYKNIPKFLPNHYAIVCKNLPLGTYTLKGKNIDLHFNTAYMLAYGDERIVDTRYTENDVLNFIIRKPCDRFLLQVKKCKDIAPIVHSLREQEVLNQCKLEQQNNLNF